MDTKKVLENTYAHSQKGMRSNFDIWSVPSTDISVLDSTFITVAPSLPLSEPRNPLLFKIPRSETQYMDLANSFLYMTVHLRNGTGDLLATDICAPGHLFFYSCFRNCVVRIN